MRRQYGDKQPGQHGIEQYLKDGIESYQPRRVFAAAAGQVVPDQYHGNAARNANENQPHHVLRLVGQQPDGQQEHERRAKHPVQKQRQANNSDILKNRRQLLVLYLGQRRVHHQNEPQRQGHIHRAHREVVHRLVEAGHEVAQRHAEGHGQEYPERQAPVQAGEFLFDQHGRWRGKRKVGGAHQERGRSAA